MSKNKKIGSLSLEKDNNDMNIEWSKSDSINDFPDKIIEVLSAPVKEESEESEEPEESEEVPEES